MELYYGTNRQWIGAMAGNLRRQYVDEETFHRIQESNTQYFNYVAFSICLFYLLLLQEETRQTIPNTIDVLPDWRSDNRPLPVSVFDIPN